MKRLILLLVLAAGPALAESALPASPAAPPARMQDPYDGMVPSRVIHGAPPQARYPDPQDRLGTPIRPGQKPAPVKTDRPLGIG